MHTVDYQRLKLKPGATILDLGCGEGRHCLGIPDTDNSNLVVGMDLGLTDLKIAKVKAREHQTFCQEQSLSISAAPSFINGNGLTLPFADNSFDLVVCSEVLEHIDDYLGIVREIKRVVKNDGQLIISVPRQWPERLCWAFSEQYSREPGGHIRIFNDRHLRKEIEDVGFIAQGQHCAHALHSPYWWLKCLLWESPDHPFIKAYHRFLVWDLLSKPLLTQILEKLLNPLMGKSVVMYFTHASDQ